MFNSYEGYNKQTFTTKSHRKPKYPSQLFFSFESWNFYLWSIYFSVQNLDEETVVKRVCLEEDVNF